MMRAHATGIFPESYPSGSIGDEKMTTSGMPASYMPYTGVGKGRRAIGSPSGLI